MLFCLCSVSVSVCAEQWRETKFKKEKELFVFFISCGWWLLCHDLDTTDIFICYVIIYFCWMKNTIFLISRFRGWWLNFHPWRQLEAGIGIISLSRAGWDLWPQIQDVFRVVGLGDTGNDTCWCLSHFKLLHIIRTLLNLFKPRYILCIDEITHWMNESIYANICITSNWSTVRV